MYDCETAIRQTYQNVIGSPVLSNDESFSTPQRMQRRNLQLILALQGSSQLVILNLIPWLAVFYCHSKPRLNGLTGYSASGLIVS